MLDRVRGLLTVELGRQRAEVAYVLALEPTLQLGEGDPSAERVYQVLGGYEPSVTAYTLAITPPEYPGVAGE
jgi:hypothetical protein